MSCGVQTYSGSAWNQHSASASRGFGMNGTSTSALGLVTSSRQASTANSQLSPMSRNSPLLAGDHASSSMGGARRSKVPAWAPSRRTRAESRSASPTAGATPGRLRSRRSSPAIGSASSSAIRDGHREDLAPDFTPVQADAITNAVLQAAEEGDHVTPTGSQRRHHRTLDQDCRAASRYCRPDLRDCGASSRATCGYRRVVRPAAHHDPGPCLC